MRQYFIQVSSDDIYETFVPPDWLKLKPEIKEAWLKELRDPASRQAHGTLCNTRGRCCLGVLLDVGFATIGDELYQQGFGIQRNMADSALYELSDLTNGQLAQGKLPTRFSLEFFQAKPDDVNGGDFNEVILWLMDYFVSMNDSHRYTFSQIANYIEKYL